MSTNLYLQATCEVVTKKSGRPAILKTDPIDLFQTPTDLTYSILNLSTFEEQLDAYCKWADSVEAVDDEWQEIYDSEIRDKQFYMTFSNEIKRSPYMKDFFEEYLVKEVVLTGEPKFEEVLNSFDKEMAFFHSNPKVNFIGVGYRLICRKPHSILLRNKIKQLQQDEYDLEFYAL